MIWMKCNKNKLNSTEREKKNLDTRVFVQNLNK